MNPKVPYFHAKKVRLFFLLMTHIPPKPVSIIEVPNCSSDGPPSALVDVYQHSYGKPLTNSSQGRIVSTILRHLTKAN